MAVQCADNSTQCLLQALILATERQQDPWSPRSFAITFIIGFAAAVISVVTVFQGLLAAGPGRIKSGPDAIGPFSRYTQRWISRSEFAYRSKAWTPILKTNELMQDLRWKSRRTRHGSDFPFEAGSKTTGATWLQLLACVGVTDDIETYFEFPRMYQECATDHLPMDLPAPPAAGQIRCIAILAAIADPTVHFDMRKEGLHVWGDTSRLSFRDHPVLGSLVAYEHYQTEPPRETKFRPKDRPLDFATKGDCTRLAFELAQGTFSLIWDEFVEEGMLPNPHPFHIFFIGDCNPDARTHLFAFHETRGPRFLVSSISLYAKALSLMVCRTDYEVRPFPWTQSGLADVVTELEAIAPRVFSSWENLTNVLTDTGFDTGQPVSYSQRDPETDLCFEAWGTWIVPVPLGSVEKMGGDFEDGASKQLFEICTAFFNRLKAVHRVKPRPEDVFYIWLGLKHVDLRLRQLRAKAIPAYNALCERLITANDDWFPGQMGAPTQTTASQPVLSSSSPTGQSPVSSSASSSSSKHSSGMNPLDMGGQSSAGSQATQQSTTASTNAASESRSLEALLVIRAVLVLALLEVGPDTSLLWKPDFDDPVVRFM